MNTFAVVRLGLVSSLLVAVSCSDDGGSSQPIQVACDPQAVVDALETTCAEGLGDIFACWNPQGVCLLATDRTRYFYAYANGARFQTTPNGGEYIGPSQEVCGEFTIDTRVESTFTNQNGNAYLVISDANGTPATVVCPNDESVNLTADASSAVDACTDVTGENAAGICGAGGALPMCTDDSECGEVAGLEYVCCDFADGSSGCTPAEYCDSP